MSHPSTPKGWATKISDLLDATLGTERFPVDVIGIAQEYSKNVFPDEPIAAVLSQDLPGFEGALFRMPANKKGWAIFYNDKIVSKGRINFTLAHEFGHYLIHRLDFPEGIQCSDQDIVRWDSEYGQIEHQANVFAANLLMPFKDFRAQIPAKATVNYDMLSHCANRYGVSLMATISQWLQYTAKRAVLVVSRDGFISWSRSSKSALKTKAFFRAAKETIEIPSQALPLHPDLLTDGRGTINHPPGVWFNEEVQEIVVLADRYDFAISLLLLEDLSTIDWPEDEEIFF
ncbi:MAG: ImmA/IrrE family metallo-endopeptidase [Vampirovibrionales bacterium]|nr:ImmA/IrrE family metallo-endopeptidase [Vampirovibrionales bacterium]